MPSKSKAQHNLMAMVANNPKAAKRVGIPQSVGQEYMKADKGKMKKLRIGGLTSYSGEDDSDMGMKMSTRRGSSDSEPKSFSAAFREARNAGLKTFKWRGGTYGTKMKGEDDEAPARPAAPARSAATASTASTASSAAPASKFKGRVRSQAERDADYAANRRASYGERALGPLSRLGDLFGLRREEDVMKRMGVGRDEARRRVSNLEKTEESEGMRHGGSVKKYAKGGSVKSSASRRADGIASVVRHAVFSKEIDMKVQGNGQEGMPS